MKINAMKETYTNARIEDDTVPAGYHVYDIRHDDECQGIPVQVGRGIVVNHWGTIITNREIKECKCGHMLLREEDFYYAGGVCDLLSFMETHSA
ncbi:MAG: LPD28 domain-containing protein [Lachnospiraceae bacterium]